MINKDPMYMVVGNVDYCNGDERVGEVSPWTDVFKTKEEAEKACEMVTKFYSKKCGLCCNFEVREIVPNTIEDLEEKLEAIWEYCVRGDN